jgi:hypothetical protein
MSYDNRDCVCGGRKETEIMLCATCQKKVKDTPQWSTFMNDHIGMPARRSAAIALLSMCRKPKYLV